jgi:hypothetical protein
MEPRSCTHISCPPTRLVGIERRHTVFRWVCPPLWSSGQSSWLQIQRSGFDSRLYQTFRQVVGLERGPLSLVSTIEELLERNSGGWGLESGEYGRRDPPRWPRGTIYPQMLTLTSPTSGGCSVGIVRSRIRPRSNVLFIVWQEGNTRSQDEWFAVSFSPKRRRRDGDYDCYVYWKETYL